jgi:hypothetical protein
LNSPVRAARFGRYTRIQLAALLLRVDAAIGALYASSDLRGWDAISLKDIGNYKLVRVQEALGRLEGAIGRLERAAAAGAASASTGAVSDARQAQERAELKAEVARMADKHAALKQSAGRVAERLDHAISRLTTSLGPVAKP